MTRHKPKTSKTKGNQAISRKAQEKRTTTPTTLEQIQSPQEKKKVSAQEAFREKPRRPVGPPEKYDPSFHPQSYIELASQGKMRAQICFAWGIHRGTLHNWLQDRTGKKELIDAIKIGDEGRSAWWSNLLTAMSVGTVKGSYNAIKMQVTNGCSQDYKNKIHFSDDLDVEDITFGD